MFNYNLGKTIGVNQPGWDNRCLKGVAAELSSFSEIIQVSYSPFIESSPLNEIVKLSAWSIRIGGCVKKDVAKVNILLTDVILPIIKEWISQQRTDVWYLNRQNLQIGLNEDISKYCILETQEGSVVSKAIKGV